MKPIRSWFSNCTLAITILPPWWLSWWATLIYVILGLAALYFSLRLAFFMLKMKNDIYIEQKVSEMKNQVLYQYLP